MGVIQSLYAPCWSMVGYTFVVVVRYLVVAVCVCVCYVEIKKDGIDTHRER